MGFIYRSPKKESMTPSLNNVTHFVFYQKAENVPEAPVLVRYYQDELVELEQESGTVLLNIKTVSKLFKAIIANNDHA